MCMCVSMMWCCDAITGFCCLRQYSKLYTSYQCFRLCKYVLQFKVRYNPDWAGYYICCFCITISFIWCDCTRDSNEQILILVYMIYGDSNCIIRFPRVVCYKWPKKSNSRSQIFNEILNSYIRWRSQARVFHYHWTVTENYIGWSQLHHYIWRWTTLKEQK